MSFKENLNKIYNIKIIILGETLTGKTSLIKTYFDKQYNPKEGGTYEPKLSLKEVEINKTKLRINLWDTMGMERFHLETKKLIKGSNIIIFVFDVTNRASFLELNFWVSIALEELSKEESILGIVGNKVDLFINSEVETTEAEEFAEKIGHYLLRLLQKLIQKVLKLL